MGAPFRTRNNTQKNGSSYECRIMRSVAEPQPKLDRPLELLAANTNNFINYKDSTDYGVTLVMLEPIFRHIMLANSRGNIPKQAVAKFEEELRDDLDHAQYKNYSIPVDSMGALALYGKNKQYLGIHLAERDYRLAGDRAIVESYIKDNYDKADGESISKRFLKKNLKALKPHITIGTINYKELDQEQAYYLVRNPTDFVVNAAYETMDDRSKDIRDNTPTGAIIFPENITLNGLSVYCQAKPK